MAYKERVIPQTVEKAKQRLAGMKTIDSMKGREQNYGSDTSPITAQTFEQQILQYEQVNAEYNSALKAADEILNRLLGLEAGITEVFTKILLSAKGKFDMDGSEIEILGGTRKSERKKFVRKPQEKK